MLHFDTLAGEAHWLILAGILLLLAALYMLLVDRRERQGARWAVRPERRGQRGRTILSLVGRRTRKLTYRPAETDRD